MTSPDTNNKQNETGYDHTARRDTPLARTIKAQIAQTGPMSLKDYMSACLHDPDHGYYTSNAAIGAHADFITAPEISQVFGELIGLWAAHTWQQMGAPDPVHIIELGPGRGTLMSDALRATKLVPGFAHAAHITLVETNATLKAAQRELLAHGPAKPHWAPSLKDAARPAKPTILIANEFIDTFPVRQFIRTELKWCERTAIVDNNALQVSHSRQETLSDPDMVQFANWLDPEILNRAKSGDILEIRQDQHQLVEPLAEIANTGTPLAALLIDYGHPEPGLGDTLQAVRNHAHEHILTAPGQADMSTQVDFAHLSHDFTNAGLVSDGPIPQATFLGNLGIIERASKLMASNPETAAQIETSIARLMSPNGMGGRFWALGTRANITAPLAGF